MDNTLGSILVLFTGWLACILADKYYKFESKAYYWFVGASTGILSGLTFSGLLWVTMDKFIKEIKDYWWFWLIMLIAMVNNIYMLADLLFGKVIWVTM